ncbi:MAG: serine/threonine-protein kinase [Kofleriaceae bacterium]
MTPIARTSELEISGYRVGRVLGEGGSGTVYGASRASDDRAVAIKVLRADLALTLGEVKRFLDEAALLQRLAHPGIVPIFASGQLDDGRPYLVMPRLDGDTLAARLARGRMNTSEAIAIFDQLADAMAALHAAGVVHRDLKPDNVFLASNGRVVLLDFGIAKDVDAEPSTTTRDGRVRGTPAYMAPERFFQARASARSDIYELAVTLYEMLAGTLPWAEVEDVSARLDPAPRDLPPALWNVLRSALASNAAQRASSVAAFREAVIAAAGAPRTVTIVRRVAAASTAPHTRSTRRGIAAVIAFAVIAATLGLAVSRGDEHGDTDLGAQPSAKFCDVQWPRPVFCTDFDRGGDFRTGFGNAGKTPDPGELGGGTIRHRDGMLVVAAPPLVAAGNKASATLFAEIPQPIRYAVVTFRMRIATELFADDTAVAMLFSLNFGPAGAINLSRRRSGTQLVVYEGKTPAKSVLGTPFAVGAWKTVKLLVHNYPTTPDGRGEVIVFVDGLAAKAPIPAALQTAPAPRLLVGLIASRGPAEAIEIAYDDVAVTTYDGPHDPQQTARVEVSAAPSR